MDWENILTKVGIGLFVGFVVVGLSKLLTAKAIDQKHPSKPNKNNDTSAKQDKQ